MVLNWGLESPQNPQAGMPALHGAGDFSVAGISLLNSIIKNGVKMHSARGDHAVARSTPPSARMAAPFVALASGEQR